MAHRLHFHVNRYQEAARLGIVSMIKSSVAAPFFLQGTAGNLYALHQPRISGRSRGAFLYVHPFAEEMNLSRRLIALQAQEIARNGFDVLMIDLYGCGDSGGDLRDARWENWIEDVATGVRWLRDRGFRQIGLWGLRLGGLLAADFASRAQTEIADLLLCQPVVNGAHAMTRFLRVATMDATATGTPASVAQLRQILQAGESVDVSGYELSQSLVSTIGEVELAPLGRSITADVHWLAHLQQTNGSIDLTSRKVIDQWKEAGTKINVYPVATPPFWVERPALNCLPVFEALREVLDRNES